MDNNGNAITVWLQSNDDGYSAVFKSEYRDGTWTHPTGLSNYISPADSDAYDPYVAMNDNGNRVTAYLFILPDLNKL